MHTPLHEEFGLLDPSQSPCNQVDFFLFHHQQYMAHHTQATVHTLFKMRCDDRTNHRSLQRCDRSQRLLGAKVTLNCHFYSCTIMRGHLLCCENAYLGNKSAILDNGTYRDGGVIYIRGRYYRDRDWQPSCTVVLFYTVYWLCIRVRTDTLLSVIMWFLARPLKERFEEEGTVVEEQTTRGRSQITANPQKDSSRSLKGYKSG